MRLGREFTPAPTRIGQRILVKRNVWVYITDLVPRQMVEFGYVLPEAGDEARWAAALPEADRAHMESFALKR